MNIIVTGASAGIGYETCIRFAQDKANTVFAIARRETLLEELKEKAPNGNIIPVVIDLGVYNYDSFLESLKSQQVTHIDILIHNAGYLVNKPFGELNFTDWEDTYKVNVIGVAMLTRSLMNVMGGQKPTHIVMISSIGGVNGSLKFSGLSAYSSSKGALCILTEMLAEEFKEKNISVNCLALGSVQTEMLEKAFPGFAANLSTSDVSRYIYDFGINGSKYYNGKILQVSTGNP